MAKKRKKRIEKKNQKSEKPTVNHPPMTDVPLEQKRDQEDYILPVSQKNSVSYEQPLLSSTVSFTIPETSLQIFLITGISLLFVLFGFLMYSNTFSSPFIFDDITQIVENSAIRMKEFNWASLAHVLEGRSARRPLPMFSFALNFYAGQYDVAGYRLINIIIHIVNSILLYLFVKATLHLAVDQKTHFSSSIRHPTIVALLSAFLWFAHPVQTNGVTYIVQRMTSMMAMFYLIAFHCYIRGRLNKEFWQKWLWFAGCGFAGICSILSKENAATLPFFLFLYEWFFLQRLNQNWLKRNLLLLLIPVTSFASLAIIFLGKNPFKAVLDMYPYKGITLWQTVMTEFRVVMHYISLMIFPHPSRLNLDYDFPPSSSLFNPITTVLSLGIIILLLWTAIYIAKKERLLSFIILWFFGNLAIESSVLALDLAFEHRLYLPSMLFFAAIILLVQKYIRPRMLGFGMLGGIVLLLGGWTYQRNRVWRDEITLWSDCVAKSPNKGRTRNNLGFALEKKGRLEEAIYQYREALRVDPYYPFQPHLNLGKVFLKQDKIEEALSHFEEALRLDPSSESAHIDIGIALAQKGQFQEAKIYLSRAVKLKPDSETAHNNLGNVLGELGEFEQAVHHFSEALKLHPYFADARNNMGIVLVKFGNALEEQQKMDEAIQRYSEALEYKPDYAKAYTHLGMAFAWQGKTQEAERHYKQAIVLNPDDALAHDKLAKLYHRQNNFTEAIKHYTEALRITPQDDTLHNNIALALVEQGETDEAMRHYRQALEINPSLALAYNNIGNLFKKQGKLDEAIQAYSEALQIDPNFAHAHYNLAVALQEQGDLLSAVTHFQEVLRIQPGYLNVEKLLEETRARLEKS